VRRAQVPRHAVVRHLHQGIRIHFIRIQHFRLNTDPDQFTDPIESGSNPAPDTDPDPQPCQQQEVS
jgi:hypothetical protein